MVDIDNISTGNLRSHVITEPNLTPPAFLGGGNTGMGMSSSATLRTPYAGNVRALAAPPIPQAPFQPQSTGFASTAFGGLGGMGFGNYGGYGGGGYGAYNSGFGGMGGFGSYGGYGGAYNRFGSGVNPNDPEARFIQLAEASSRPAFQSIESLVSAIGNIAAMLDSTFFALTSSFRAILGVAANFGRLRSVFAQFWGTFAIFRGLNWIYRKILYWLRISDLDPSSAAFKKAFAEALSDTTNSQNGVGGAQKPPRRGQSPWPVLAFISFIFTAPYLIMKLLGTVTNTAQEEARNPAKWMTSINTIALFDFQARNASELSLRAGTTVQVAPREIQQTMGLLNTGWALASINGQNSGIIPINYVKSPQQLRQERQQLNPDDRVKLDQVQPPVQGTNYVVQQPDLVDINQQPESMNLSASAFPPPPMQELIGDIAGLPDFDIAPQPLGPPTTDVAALAEGFA